MLPALVKIVTVCEWDGAALVFAATAQRCSEAVAAAVGSGGC